MFKQCNCITCKITECYFPWCDSHISASQCIVSWYIHYTTSIQRLFSFAPNIQNTQHFYSFVLWFSFVSWVEFEAHSCPQDGTFCRFESELLSRSWWSWLGSSDSPVSVVLLQLLWIFTCLNKLHQGNKTQELASNRLNGEYVKSLEVWYVAITENTTTMTIPLLISGSSTLHNTRINLIDCGSCLIALQLRSLNKLNTAVTMILQKADNNPMHVEYQKNCG